jgi:HAD superfamily hydrolase (TIGR01509 family)
MKKEVKKYKAIIFDLDGTLIDSMPYHFQAFKETLKEHGVSMKDATLKHFMGSSTRKILRDIKRIYHFHGKIEDVREERRYHYFQALGKRNILFKGVKKLINSLKKDYKLAIATGSSRVSVRYSITKEFQKMFEYIVTVNDVENGKPAPDQLLFAARKLKVKPSECLMVGDSIYDILAAKKAKMDSVGVLTGYTTKKELLEVGAKKVLKNVVDIKSYLNN